MQPVRISISNLASNKPKLLVVIAISILAVLVAPVLAPHLAHPSMFYHILLHAGSIIIAVFLAIVSALSYRRMHRGKILLTAFSFLALLVVELLNLFNVVSYNQLLTIPGVDIELSHVFLLGMLTLFGTGVLRVEK